MEHFAPALVHFIDREGYAALFVVIVLGNIGLPIGVELILPLAGALVAQDHLSSVWLAALVAVCGELTGQAILYAVGMFGGRPVVERYGKYIGVTRHKLDVAHAFYERYGNRTVFLCRFVPFIRGIAGLPAGISRMHLGHFFAYTAAGSAVFCLGLIALGNALGAHLDQALPYIRTTGLLLLAAAVVGVAVYFLLRRRAEGREPA